MEKISISKIEYELPMIKGTIVTFTFNNGVILRGVVSSGPSRYFINIYTDDNDAIFKMLGIKKEEFVKKVVGYTVTGIWPEVKSIKDLMKVLDALLRYNKYSTASDIVTVNKKKHTNLNFKI